MGNRIAAAPHAAAATRKKRVYHMKNLRDLYDLTGKVAIVTGGRGLYGASISTGLCEMGATVVIASRNVEKCEELVQKYTNTAIEMLGAFEDNEYMIALAKSLTDRKV